MKKFISLLILCISFIPYSYSQGLLKNSEATERIRKNVRVQKSRSLNMPTSYSLEKYTPHVFNQGESSMCAAYSLALARTIVYARNNNLTNKNKISAEAYSPYFIYSKYKSSTGEDFSGGLTMYFNKLNEYGYAKMKEVEYPHYYPFTQNQLWNFAVPSYLNLNQEFIQSEKFDDINCIYINDVSSVKERNELVEMVKSEIANKRPILFGLNLYNTFYYSEDYWSDTITTWCDFKLDEEYCYKSNDNPSGKCNEHKPADYYAGHAMTIVAYNDDKYGGSFLIQNSWGRDAHNEGKVWIPYDVFARLAEDIQSFDKDPKSEFEETKTKTNFNYPEDELNFNSKDFSQQLDLNWILFTALSIEDLKEKDAKKGKINLPNNLRIKGALKDNLLEGEGEINLNNIYIYNGNFKKGSFNGTGILKRLDKWGDIISERRGVFQNGDFIEGRVDEIITRKYDSRQGCTYTGLYKNGDFNGAGILSHNQYEFSVEANFVDGFPAVGRIKISDWYNYDGEINRALNPHGFGVLIEDGEKIEGEFDNGEFIK
jgi:hypothetical protein